MGIGAVLLQTNGAGKFRIIAFASHLLRATEKNYSVIRLDNLAVVWALKHFIDIIIGFKTTVYTNQSPSIEIFKGRNLYDRLVRRNITI